MNILHRLKKLEAECQDDYSEIKSLIRQGKYYDELTEEQKELYCKYRGLEKSAFEEVNQTVIKTLHCKIEYKPKICDLRQVISEVEELITGKN